MPNPKQLEKYLVCDLPGKEWVPQKIIGLLAGDGVIPAFSASAMKLGQLTRDPDVSMDDIKDVIEMDPGLSADCTKVASSAGFAARRISSIHQALMLIGIKEISRIAFAMGVMKKFDQFNLDQEIDLNLLKLINTGFVASYVPLISEDLSLVSGDPELPISSSNIKVKKRDINFYFNQIKEQSKYLSKPKDILIYKIKDYSDRFFFPKKI